LFIADNNLLLALSPIPDQAPVEDQPGYTSVLQRELQVLVGSSVSRVSRSDLTEPKILPAGNTVLDGTKLQ
jgi:hypothetical protein